MDQVNQILIYRHSAERTEHTIWILPAQKQVEAFYCRVGTRLFPPRKLLLGGFGDRQSTQIAVYITQSASDNARW
jgi:hypothetical protein